MDSSLEGAASDSLERSKMNLDQKRQHVYELSKNPDEAFKVLKSWTSQELRDILCLESKKQRKYTGLAKEEIIKIILNIVSDKNNGDDAVEEKNSTPSTSKSKRQRTTSTAQTKGKGTTIWCKNWACKAIILNGKDNFCKRCSCYICHKFDGNKDPSLWLNCDGESCGCSFHLECVINSDKYGLKEDKPSHDLDDCIYSCVSCGKKNNLLERWKKQLEIAKETESVNELRQRLLLAQKLLMGTEKYKDISEIVDKAAESLVTELCGPHSSVSSSKCRGPLSSIPSSKCRGSIKRLGSNAKKVKDHCSSALESLQEELNVADGLLSLLANNNNLPPPPISSNTSSEENQEAVPEDLPIAPLRLDQINDHQDRPESANNMENSINCGFGLKDFIKIMRQLESSGLIERSVREKFLSWYGLTASANEKNVVKLFVYGFKDDPKALVDQLMHSFSKCLRH